MRTLLSGAILTALVALFTAAQAQEYGSRAPIPRTTSAPALRAAAREREVRERFTIGIQDEQSGAWSKAAAEFERILQLTNTEPQHSTAQYNVSRAYAGLHRYDDAARMLRAAIDADPQFLAAYANLISIDLARHDLREARAYADRFTALAPDSARALYSRGLVALASNDARTAQADFGKLLQTSPSYAIAHYDLGIAETQAGRFGEAQREFESALALSPGYARARFALATVLLRQGHRSQARVALDATVRDASGDPALRELAAALRDTLK